MPNWRRLPLTRWFRCGDDVLIARQPAKREQVIARRTCLQKDSRRRDFSQRLPVSLGFTKRQSLERLDATLTCVDGRGRAVPAFPPESAFPDRATTSREGWCHAPSKVLPGPSWQHRSTVRVCNHFQQCPSVSGISVIRACAQTRPAPVRASVNAPQRSPPTKRLSSRGLR